MEHETSRWEAAGKERIAEHKMRRFARVWTVRALVALFGVIAALQGIDAIMDNPSTSPSPSMDPGKRLVEPVPTPTLDPRVSTPTPESTPVPILGADSL